MQEPVTRDPKTAHMAWAAGLGSGESLDECVQAAAAQVRQRLGEGAVDLVAVFVSSQFRRLYEKVPRTVLEALPAGHLVGCSGGGVIGDGMEVEDAPAVSLVAARLPDVSLHVFHVRDEETPDLDGGPSLWEGAVGIEAAAAPQFVLLADPHSFNMENFAAGLDFAFPRAAKVGGLASDARQPGGNALFLEDRCWRGGLVGLALSGRIAMDTVVAQGCRPIGEPMLVTRCHRNLIMELDGCPPLERIHELTERLDQRDQALMRTSLFLGIVMDPSKGEFHHGDFLIRNLVGLDRERGILAVGALVRKGQTVQFHLRDAEKSAEDLAHMLEGYRAGMPAPPAAALLFSCLGRGRHLYGRPDHDSQMFARHVGPVPLGGFFCNGEIGPVAGSTYVHGYTSCFGLIREG